MEHTMSVRKPTPMTERGSAKCRQCGKPAVPTDRIGSMTVFMFQGKYCACNKTVVAGKNQAAKAPAKAPPKAVGSDFCPRCGLYKAGQSKPGSLTGYLFQDTRCRCVEDEKFDSSSMSQRFWKLKQEEGAGFKSSQTIQESTTKELHVDLIEGAVIAGAYEIVKLIGRGGMGEVYLAKHKTLGKPCALKVIPPEQVNDVGWQRFQTEAKLFAKLDHINLVRVSDLGIHEGCLPFYAMDFIEGKTLSDYVAQNGILSLQEAIEIFKQVCDGVGFAHRHGIIHRDLKPANIMINGSVASPHQSKTRGQNRPEALTVKILDFGLAKLTQHDRDQQSLTAIGEVFGSPFYMSPEQCSGEKVDNRSDIYSVGCALFESLTERPPFSATIAAAVMNGHMLSDPPSLESIVGPGRFPESMELVLAKLLRKNPAERYQTMDELKGDLEKWSGAKASSHIM